MSRIVLRSQTTVRELTAVVTGFALVLGASGWLTPAALAVGRLAVGATALTTFAPLGDSLGGAGLGTRLHELFGPDV